MPDSYVYCRNGIFDDRMQCVVAWSSPLLLTVSPIFLPLSMTIYMATPTSSPTHIRPHPSPPQGLSDDVVHFRQRRDGPNAITPPRQLPEFLKFLKNLVGGFALLLWAAAIMSVVAYGIQQATSDGGDQSNVSVCANVVMYVEVMSHAPVALHCMGALVL